MLHWLVDHVNAAYLVLGLVAFILAVLYWRNRQTSVLIALGVFVVFLGVVWLLTVLIVMDRKAMTLAVREMAAAVGQDRPERIAEHLARDFKFQEMTKESAGESIKRRVKGYAITNVHVWQIDVEKLNRAEGKARVTFLARVDAVRDAGFFRCRGDWVLEDGKWRMRTFQIFNPVVHADQPIPVP